MLSAIFLGFHFFESIKNFSLPFHEDIVGDLISCKYLVFLIDHKGKHSFFDIYDPLIEEVGSTEENGSICDLWEKKFFEQLKLDSRIFCIDAKEYFGSGVCSELGVSIMPKNLFVHPHEAREYGIHEDQFSPFEYRNGLKNSHLRSLFHNEVSFSFEISPACLNPVDTRNGLREIHDKLISLPAAFYPTLVLFERYWVESLMTKPGKLLDGIIFFIDQICSINCRLDSIVFMGPLPYEFRSERREEPKENYIEENLQYIRDSISAKNGKHIFLEVLVVNPSITDCHDRYAAWSSRLLRINQGFGLIDLLVDSRETNSFDDVLQFGFYGGRGMQIFDLISDRYQKVQKSAFYFSSNNLSTQLLSPYFDSCSNKHAEKWMQRLWDKFSENNDIGDLALSFSQPYWGWIE